LLTRICYFWPNLAKIGASLGHPKRAPNMQLSLGFMAFIDMDSHGRHIQGSVWQGKKRVEWGIGWLGTAYSLSKAWHGRVQYCRSRVRAWHNRVEQHGTTGAVPCVSDLLTPARLIPC
jgi:hypothetical protein